MTIGLPVTVVTGFLGAGKTTLVNRWLGDFPRGEVAVIVNEHGEAGIDGALLAARVETLIEITGGCVCCATQAELVRALEAIASSASPPKRVLVETSGAASPAGVLRAVAAGAGRGAFVLDGVVTIADASRWTEVAAEDLAIEQIGYADVVVLSRADACDADGLARAKDSIATSNGAALVVAAARGELEDPALRTLDALLDHRRADFGPKRPLASLSGDHVYESISLLHEGDVDGERFADFMEASLASVAGRLFRTKGILAVEGVAERMIVQGVADLVEVTFGAPWGRTPRSSRFVVVGYGLDRASLTRAFAACVVRS